MADDDAGDLMQLKGPRRVVRSYQRQAGCLRRLAFMSIDVPPLKLGWAIFLPIGVSDAHVRKSKFYQLPCSRQRSIRRTAAECHRSLGAHGGNPVRHRATTRALGRGCAEAFNIESDVDLSRFLEAKGG